MFAAGDVTAEPIKQGGLATQQADAAAEMIAAEAGAPITPRPCRRVLRGVVLTGERAAVPAPRPRRRHARWPAPLRGAPAGVSRVQLWWPSGKIAGRYLTGFLAAAAAPASANALTDRAERTLPRREARGLGAENAHAEAGWPLIMRRGDVGDGCATARRRRRDRVGAELALGAVAVTQDRVGCRRARARSRAARVRGELGERALDQTASAIGAAADGVDDGAVEAVAGGAPLVLVGEHRVAAARSPPRHGGVAAHERLDVRGERDRVLDRLTASITRTSTVPKRGCGRTSHQMRV